MRIIILLILYISTINANKITYYHNLKITDSSPTIVKWNVNKDNIGKYYVVELVDSLNRVVELRFFKNGKLFEQSCYVTPIIKFEYKTDKIIEYNYKNEVEFRTELECGDFQKIDYFLENDLIIKCKNYIPDLSFISDGLKNNKDLQGYYDYLKQYENGIEEDCHEIIGYGYSMKKYSGKNLKCK